MTVIALREPVPRIITPRCKSGATDISLRALNALLRLGLPDVSRLDEFGFSTRQLRGGEPLIHCGDACEAIYAVRFGSLRTVIIDANGSEQGMGFPMATDVIGTDGLATGLHTSRTVALERSEVVVIPLARVAEIARMVPAFDLMVYRMIGREIARDHAVLYVLGSLNAEGRVAAFLLGLSDRYGELGYSRTVFNLRMTRHDIAGYLGLTLETVSRAFSAYAASELLRVNGREIEILDMEALRRAMTEPSAVLRRHRNANALKATPYTPQLAIAC